jgi:glycolate oxidase iron-sulfur subunit
MQTRFTDAQLADPAFAASNQVLRTCVHCGFCTATCPTFVLLGDELDSPRGRIYLIKDMLEGNRPATAEVVRHVDRCLSCLSCMTTCPSGVNYMHLVDHARAYIEDSYTRPWHDRALRAVLARVLPKPGLFRAALIAARLARPLAALLPRSAPPPEPPPSEPPHAPPSQPPHAPPLPGPHAPPLPRLRALPLPRLRALPLRRLRALPLRRLRAMLELAPAALPPAGASARPAIHPAEGARRGRVALLTGCAQTVLAPAINEATIRLLTRLGIEVVVAEGVGCCGALTHHMGRHAEAMHAARAAIAGWHREIAGEGLDAIVINTSGCGTTVKDYGFMFRAEPSPWRARAEAVSALATDITEYLARIGYTATRPPSGLRAAYHAACSLQHGQRVTAAPKDLLRAAGFVVLEPRDAHLCCGSAGTYNILQPDIAGRLRDRKLQTIAALQPDLIAAGNIGCLTQLGGTLPAIHTIELLDWMAGGPEPARLPPRPEPAHPAPGATPAPATPGATPAPVTPGAGPAPGTPGANLAPATPGAAPVKPEATA